MKKLCLLLSLLLLATTGYPQGAAPDVPLDSLLGDPQQAPATPKTTPKAPAGTRQGQRNVRGANGQAGQAAPAAAAQTEATAGAEIKPTPKPQATPAQAAAATPGPMVIQMDRVRVLRALTFDKELKTKPLIDPQDVEQWYPSMIMQFRLEPPRGWDLVSVDEAKVLQVLDQNNQPVPEMTTSPGSPNPLSPQAKMNPLSPVMLKTRTGAIVLIRTTPPPARAEALNQLDVRFKVTLGQKKTVYVKDLRQTVGQPFLRNENVTDLAMQVNQIGKDEIEVAAAGNIARVGEMRFADAESGRPLEPYTSEVVTPEIGGELKNPMKRWIFGFTQLPQGINMTVDIYPTAVQKTVSLKFKVPLPQ